MVEFRTRALALGLVVASVAGCGDERKPPIEGPVGLVASLEGTAAAKRGDDPERPLAMGATVFAKDTIIVSVKGDSIDIKFEGVDAPWTLTGPATKSVSEASAWDAVVEHRAMMARGESEGNRGAGKFGGRTGGMNKNEVVVRQVEPAQAKGPVATSDSPDFPEPTPPPDTVDTKTNLPDTKVLVKPNQVPKVKPPSAPPPKLRVGIVGGTKSQREIKGHKASGSSAVVLAVKTRRTRVLECGDKGDLLVTIKVSKTGTVNISAKGKFGPCVEEALAGLSIPKAANSTVDVSLRW